MSLDKRDIELSKHRKGITAEAFVVYRAFLAGYNVSFPIASYLPYDLIVEIPPKLEKWQVKSGVGYRKSGPFVQVKRHHLDYKPEDFQTLAAVCLKTETIWIVPHSLIEQKSFTLKGEWIWGKGQTLNKEVTP